MLHKLLLITFVLVCFNSCAIHCPKESIEQQPIAIRPAFGHIPSSILRLATLYPKASNYGDGPSYAELEAKSFLLKTHRPKLQIVDRTSLQGVLEEQSRQLDGSVADNSISRIGHLLGADSLLFYRIESPTLRDQVWFHVSGSLSPVKIYSKVIRVETGEVIFHNVVAVPIQSLPVDSSFQQLSPMIKLATERAITRTIEDLSQAFR